MATYDPFAVANKKKVRRGPDGLPIMEADAMKRPPIGQYGIASTPFPITGQPARPMAVDTPPPVKPSLAATRTPEAPFERVASNDYAPDHGLLGPPPPPIQTPGRAQAAPPAPGPMAVDGPPPLPFNSARAPDRARALTMRTLHSGPGGLDPTKEARIAQIYGAQDQRDAYARANRPLQTVQSPSEIQNRHSELGRNLVSGFRTELEGIDQQINAVQNEPLSEDKQRRLDVLVAQRANKAAQLDKAVNDPYWQQTSPARAGEIQAGQQRLRDRQMSDRTSGAADVAAYQGRQQYDRNAADEMRQAEFARQRAAIGAETAGYGAQTAAANAIQQSGGLTPEQQVQQIEANMRKREMEDAAAARASGAGHTTQADAEAAVANRNNAAAKYGFTEDFHSNVTNALKSIGDGMNGWFARGRVTGGAGGFAEDELRAAGVLDTEVGRIEKMFQTDPAVASEMAASVLNDQAFPLPADDGTYGSAWGILPGGNRDRAKVADTLNSVRSRLSRMAGWRQ